MRILRALALAAPAAVVLLTAGCGGDDDGGGDGGSEPPPPAAPDGTYSSDVGPNDEQVTFDVEDEAITHLSGKVFGDCGGTTISQETEGDVDIPIEDGEVSYSSESGGATLSLSGSFDDGTFEGTFGYVDPASVCPADEWEFVATSD